jgi:hypothetical protein
MWTTDDEGYMIGKSELLTLSGVNKPTNFKFVQITLDETNAVG